MSAIILVNQERLIASTVKIERSGDPTNKADLAISLQPMVREGSGLSCGLGDLMSSRCRRDSERPEQSLIKSNDQLTPGRIQTIKQTLDKFSPLLRRMDVGRLKRNTKCI